MRGRMRARGVFAAGLVALAALPAGAQTTTCSVQGTGPVPTLVGTRVSVAGVVTADASTTPVEGFFIQDFGCDADPASSDALFVRTGRRSVGVSVGRRVTVTGRVGNATGQTEIEYESHADGGAYAGTLEVVALAPPADPAAAAVYLEAREGMLVALPASRVVGATERTGTAFVLPDAAGVTRLFRGSPDGRKVGVRSPAGWLSLNAGDRVGDVVGPLSFDGSDFVVLTSEGRTVSVERSGPAPVAAAGAAGLSFAAVDLGDLFDAADDPARTDTVPADYGLELARRAQSIGRYAASPDVVAVHGAETAGVLLDLAAQPALLAAGYRTVLVEGTDGRGLDVGVLYGARFTQRSAEARPACGAVAPAEGGPTSCTTAAGSPGWPLFAQPPLVVKLATADTDERLTVVAVRFRGGSSASDAAARAAQADHVRAVVAELAATESSVPVIVAGNVNEGDDLALVARLTSDGRLADPNRWTPPAYTTVSQGVSAALDGLLVSPSLQARVVECAPVHVHADYAAPAPGAAADATSRSSDRDPVRLVLRR